MVTLPLGLLCYPHTIPPLPSLLHTVSCTWTASAKLDQLPTRHEPVVEPTVHVVVKRDVSPRVERIWGSHGAGAGRGV